MTTRTPIHEAAPKGKPRTSGPVVAITMGDVGGVGPEVILKSVLRASVRKACRPLLVGDLEYLKALARRFGIPVKLRRVTSSGRLSADAVLVDDCVRLSGRAPLGRPSKIAGRAAAAALKRAVDLALEARVEGIVTAPVSKESFALAGYGMVGHTEVLAEITGTRDYAMMLLQGKLRVVFATTHVRHRDVARRLTRTGLLKKIRLTRKYLERYMGIRDALIGVACLNPHCGEGGRLGREEQDVIRPAVKAAGDEGICVEGPLPADSIYRPAIAGGFDAVIAMYHDQGMIPLKLRGHGEVVNITLGIPLLRTSPGHGTAFDIAGGLKASDRSLVSAVLECARIAKRLRYAG